MNQQGWNADPVSSRANNFNVARVVFAILVIVSHSPELLDGNRSREIATAIWGTLSFGEIAVDGFFLVSGYLIVQSFERSRSPGDFLRKRILRIYPGFVAAYAFCFLVVAPLAGAAMPALAEIAKRTAYVLLLVPPWLPNTFTGLPYPLLNGAMWTIAYEFRCYLLVAVLGMLGVLRYRMLITVAALACLAAAPFHPFLDIPNAYANLIGKIDADLRFTGCFLAGALFYLWRGRISYSGRGALASALVLLLCLYSPWLAEPALATFGAYALFYLVFSAPPIGHWIRHDISYGLYLYAWPIQNLIIYYAITRNPVVLAALTMLLGGCIGMLSWLLIEHPFLRRKQSIPAVPS